MSFCRLKPDRALVSGDAFREECTLLRLGYFHYRVNREQVERCHVDGVQDHEGPIKLRNIVLISSGAAPHGKHAYKMPMLAAIDRKISSQ